MEASRRRLEAYLHDPSVAALAAEDALIPKEEAEAEVGRKAEAEDDLALLWKWLCRYWQRGRKEGFTKVLMMSCARRRRDPRVLSDSVIDGCFKFLTIPEVGRLKTISRKHRMMLSSPTRFEDIATAHGVDPRRLQKLAHLDIAEQVEQLENIIAFNFSSTFLHDRFKPLLKRFVNTAKRHQKAKVIVESHSDPARDVNYQQRNSQVRGITVLQEMANLGLDQSRIELKACCQLPAINRPRTSLEHNRVDIYIEMDGRRFPAEQQEPTPTMLSTMSRNPRP
eukprot:TRINITY_DN40162_c0_g1_i1.p1 TRINITY_DN40162_c0_g1~~TRINITY_DN40162_c0_g1_i1.p1  ORF type:complete len:299 (+),score=36.81 TRINITY_DN40162_c0_g1_i1:55-897(+)